MSFTKSVCPYERWHFWFCVDHQKLIAVTKRNSNATTRMDEFIKFSRRCRSTLNAWRDKRILVNRDWQSWSREGRFLFPSRNIPMYPKAVWTRRRIQHPTANNQCYRISSELAAFSYLPLRHRRIFENPGGACRTRLHHTHAPYRCRCYPQPQKVSLLCQNRRLSWTCYPLKSPGNRVTDDRRQLRSPTTHVRHETQIPPRNM